jgi:hypothetical protein
MKNIFLKFSLPAGLFAVLCHFAEQKAQIALIEPVQAN